MSRPSKGDRTAVAMRIPAELMEPLERLALTQRADRHDVILVAITRGLVLGGSISAEAGARIILAL